MTPEQAQQLISRGETMEVEFKGEERVPLSDRVSLTTLTAHSLNAPEYRPRIGHAVSNPEFTPQAYVQNR